MRKVVSLYIGLWILFILTNNIIPLLATPFALCCKKKLAILIIGVSVLFSACTYYKIEYSDGTKITTYGKHNINITLDEHQTTVTKEAPANDRL